DQPQIVRGGCRVAFTDKTLTCVDCGASFTFSARDQEFHAEKGFANEPKRCFACRQARRVQRGDAPAGAGAGAGQRPQRQPVYAGPRAQSTGPSSGPSGGGRSRGGRDGGRPRGRRDFERGGRGEDGGSSTAQRSFDGGAGAPAAYTA